MSGYRQRSGAAIRAATTARSWTVCPWPPVRRSQRCWQPARKAVSD